MKKNRILWDVFLDAASESIKIEEMKEKKSHYQQNYVSSVCFFYSLPRIFCNVIFQLKLLPRAKEELSISSFLFPPSLMY